jgi:hypothetical protein
MKNILVISFLLFQIDINAQVQRCGLPNYRPRNGEANMFIDTCNRLSYLWNGSIWFNQNDIISESAPQIILSNGGVQSSNAKISWYKPSTGAWYNVVGSAWQNRVQFSVDSILAANNRWTGKNTFADSLKTDKGMISGGLIDTKGLNTEGTSTKAAANINGVQSERDTVVSANFTLSGLYKAVGFNCTSGQRDCIFPSPTNTINWIYVIRKEDNSTNDLVFKTSANVEFYRLKSKMTVVFKNVGGVWRRQLL